MSKLFSYKHDTFVFKRIKFFSNLLELTYKRNPLLKDQNEYIKVLHHPLPLKQKPSLVVYLKITVHVELTPFFLYPCFNINFHEVVII